jgi:hypothetical protein
MINPPSTPPTATIIPVDISPDTLPPAFNLLVSTTAWEPPEPDTEPEASAPVAEGETLGVCAAILLVGAGTPLMDAAKLKGAIPLES